MPLQVAFETQELMAVPQGARGVPKTTTPAAYFHGGGPPSDLNLMPVTSARLRCLLACALAPMRSVAHVCNSVMFRANAAPGMEGGALCLAG